MTEPTPRDPAEPATPEGDGGPAAAEPGRRAAMLEAALGHMDQGLVVLDRAMRVVFWNRRYLELWGFPTDLVRVGVPLDDLIRFDTLRHGLGRKETEELLALRIARSRTQSTTTEVRLPHLGRILRVDRHRLPDGGSVSTFTDVTAARRQAEALAASEARFAAYTRLSADWIWEQDADLRFTFVSRPKEVHLDVFPGENVGKRRDELDIVADDQEAWRRHLDDLAQRRPFRNFAYRRRDRQGELRNIVISGEPILAEDGRFLGYRGTGTDVTELKRAEHDLRIARDQAEAANRAKNEFLASMSHELRTPLNAIMGFAEILKDELFGRLGSERYRGYAEDILTSATYLMELIRDVLDMSRIEAGRVDLEVAPIEIGPEVRRCLDMVRGSARSAGLTLEMDRPAGMPRVLADSRAVRQILLNLLSNAVKFTPPGGRIAVTVAAAAERARISVADTGVGIPAWAIPRLGRPFEQVENVLQRRRPGSGLGLALSRSLAGLMDGTIEIESTEGRGTTVTLSLPLASRATE